MTLEQLKAALDAALAALAADKENADLQGKAEAAQAAYDAKKAEEDGGSDDDLDESKFDEKTKAYLAKLRKENASHRTKGKELASKLTAEQKRTKDILKAAGIETEEDKPEEKIKALSEQTSNLVFRNAILTSALEQGIPKSGIKYYQYLITEASGELEENEELSDEKLKEIVAEVKKSFSGKTATSTVTGKDGKIIETPNPEAGGVTFEKFCAMGIIEKSKLYEKNPGQYEEFMKLAKSKKKAV